MRLFSRPRPIILLIFCILFAVVGYIYLNRSHAATNNADINGDGTVNIVDLSIMATNWGKSGQTFSQGDINGDGVINILDLSILASNWGATASNSGFISVCSTQLCQNGQPYRFTGINIYMAASGGTPSSCGGELYPDVSVPLSDMPDGITFRMWAFQNFFESNGTFNWTNFDQVLSIAAAHNDKIIPALANQYNYCEPNTKDISWYQTGYKNTVEPGDAVTYRQYVSNVVSRYANNPTIAMWQLVNEGEAVNSDGTCSESAALSAMLGFSNDVGGLVHSLDPNHPVSLGALAGYSGAGIQWCDAANSDYQTLMASPGNDVCDFHDYGYPANPMGNPSAPNLASAIQMCHADGKPIMVGETGIFADNDGALATRASEFNAKFTAQFQAGVVGELMWAWSVKPAYVIPDSDPDYGIFPGDPSLNILGTF